MSVPLPLIRAGHHAWKLQVVGLTLVGATFWFPPGAMMRPFVPGISMMVAGLLLAAAHTVGSRCERCVANSPRAGAVEAFELRPVLTAFHRLCRPGPAAALVAVYAVAFVVSNPWDQGLRTIFASVLAAGVVLCRLHRPVRPWCHHCNDLGGGGGHDDLADTPAPTHPSNH